MLRMCLRPLRALLPLFALVGPGCAGTWSDQRALIRSLDHEVVALQLQNEDLRQRLETCDTEESGDNQLYFELRQVFADKEVLVDVDGEAVLVVVPGYELLTSGGVKLREEGRWVLDLLSIALQLHEDHAVEVIVHTADTPPASKLARTYPNNWAVSSAGAASIASALIEDFGLRPARVYAVGRAGTEPVADNSTREGQLANHRVVFRLTPMEASPPARSPE
ncbi:MAG: OmpA family protein [Alphaproteobacteria bacterium]|nr:OmpA family protein [Alphaproteobacteria bacterium]